jgi:hypothetical protein
MKWQRELILIVLSILTLELADAETMEIRMFLATITEGPVNITREDLNWSVQYCPDNTCDLLKFSTSLNEKDLERLVLGYFVYISSYIYLKEWQENAREDEEIQSEIRYLINEECPKRGGKQLVECRLRELMSIEKLTVFHIRYDEGIRSAVRVYLDDVIR